MLSMSLRFNSMHFEVSVSSKRVSYSSVSQLREEQFFKKILYIYLRQRENEHKCGG